MREYCTEKAHPADADTVANIMASFGWELIDADEIYNENTQVSGVQVKLYGDDFFGGFMKGWTGNDGQVNVKTYTTVTNYVTMRFVRDTEITDYDELNNLQNEFMHYLGEMRMPEKPKKLVLAAVVVALFSLATIISIFESNVAVWAIIFPILAIVGSVLTIVFGWINYRKREQYYYLVYSKAKSVLEQALSLHTN